MNLPLSTWKTWDSLPNPIKEKNDDDKLDPDDIQTLMEYGPTVRKLFPHFFDKEGSLRRVVDHTLDYVQDRQFTQPSLVLNSLNPGLIKSFVGRHMDKRVEEGEKEQTQTKASNTTPEQASKPSQSKPHATKNITTSMLGRASESPEDSSTKDSTGLQAKFKDMKGQLEDARKLQANHELLIRHLWLDAKFLLESKRMDQWYFEMQEDLKTMDKRIYYESNKTT
ncbi:unnamed protein product [Penicillium camemberti]|uniref:Str. FM013 n=1 Tax=Penicillium camemberti (strain FM 013) TaxID=1429867 RepID=A0A0G4P7M8_PENC3|nr:unnamed protein product [Penicillium camemberti]